MTLDFKINGVVYVKETKHPIPNVIVRAYDKDLLFDDLLGDTTTDNFGRFELQYSEIDFKDLFEKQPDIYFRIFDPSGKKLIHLSVDSVRWNAEAEEYFEIPIPKYKIPMLKEDHYLLNSQGVIRNEFEPGDNLFVNFKNLAPNQAYDIRLLDNDGIEIVSVSLVSDRYGVIEPTLVWPDIGIGIPREGIRFANETIEEALEELAGSLFELEISKKKEKISTIKFSISKSLKQRRVFPVSESMKLQRGLLFGRDELRISGYNFPPGALLDIYLVNRQYNWFPGDSILPIQNPDGSEVIKRVQLDQDETSFTTTLWSRDQLRLGSYDIIIRSVIEHEYRANERVLRDTDFVSEQLLTTFVVRDNIYRIKPVYLGCVNAIDIAGKKLYGSPYFKFTNNFPKGTDIFAALDPAGLIPDLIGNKVRFYVVAHKDDTQWSADSSLIDVTGTISEVITSSGCINANKTRVWSNPQQTGAYDLIADFGNNEPDPQNFASDDSFDPPIDMIDGYFKVGFYVTEDPSIITENPIGRTSYVEPAVDILAEGVWYPGGEIEGDTDSGTLSLILRAEVRYPADFSDVDAPVSGTLDKYPLFVIMHGMHTTDDPSYLGYNYLLDHLASHGFIAVSIDCNPINAINGFQDTRAYAMLEHLLLLQSLNNNPGLFQGKIDMSRIGIMGHSRGGDGVVQAEIYNQSLGYGFSIQAIIALAPTDFSGTSPDPLSLTTSNFLCIYGNNDGDVWGQYPPSTNYTGTGFRFYDRASIQKAMVFIVGATHNRFNREWETEGIVDTSAQDVLAREQHEVLLCGYVTAFLQAHLLGRSEQLDYFNGELKIPQVEEIEVHYQYRPSNQDLFTLDHFESNPEVGRNSSGGNVTPSNLDGAPIEDEMGTLDMHSPHQTRGVKLKWNNTSATYQSVITVQRDISGYKFLSFRVSQTVEEGDERANPIDQLQDFYVQLNTGGGGNYRSIKIGYFGDIPFPDSPDYITSLDSWEELNTKAALKSIRIPLSAWTIKCLSAPIVDLTNIESIKFELKSNPTGEILVDDIEFTK